MKTKRNLKRILSVILTVLMIMSTLAVGVVSTSAAEIPAGTTLYIDATKFIVGGRSDSNEGVYVSVSADTNKDYRGDKELTTGVGYNGEGGSTGGYYAPKKDDWNVTITSLGNDIYSVYIPNASTVGKISVWSKDASTYEDIYQLDCSLNNTYDGTNNMLVIGDGCTQHQGQDSYCYSGTWTTYNSGGSTTTKPNYYYIGTDNSWTEANKIKLTDNGDYAYYKLTQADNTFKIGTDDNVYAYNTFTNGHNGTDGTLSSESDGYGGNNIKSASIQYIIVYYPTTTDGAPTICASSTLPDNGGSTTTTPWCITGRFGAMINGTMTYTATGISLADGGNGWNDGTTSDIKFTDNKDGTYSLDTGLTISDLAKNTGTNSWYFQFCDGTNKYRPSTSDAGILKAANAGTEFSGTTTDTYSYVFATSDAGVSDTTATVTLKIDDTGTTPKFSFSLVSPTTAGTVNVAAAASDYGTVTLTNGDSTVTPGTANPGDTFTVATSVYSNYASYYTAGAVTCTYKNPDKTTGTVTVTDNAFTIPADAVAGATFTVTAAFNLDKQAYANAKSGLFLEASAANTDTTATLIGLNNYSGSNHGTSNAYTFYVPGNVDLTDATIYNGYNNAVTLNGSSINANSSAVITLQEGDNTLTGVSGISTVKVMKGSTSAMFLYTSTGKGADYNLPTCTSDSRVVASKYYDTYAKEDMYRKDDIKASAGECVTSLQNDDGTYTTSATLGVTQVKGRGNSSWKASAELFGKYAFNMKLDDAINLFGMDKGGKGSKSWCLLANNMDQSMLRNALTYGLADEIGIINSPEFKFVDIYDNGEYMGAYLVTEKVDVGSKKLVKGTSIDDIHEDLAKTLNETVNENQVVAQDSQKEFTTTGGNTIQYNCAVVSDNNLTAYDTAFKDQGGTFLLEFELEKRVRNEISWFRSAKGQYVTVKSPEFATEKEIQFIAEKFDQMETAIYANKTYSELSGIIDVDSFAKMYLIQELSANLDSAATSYYITYSLANGEANARFVASPVWDYDWAYGQHNGTSKQGIPAEDSKDADRYYMFDGSNDVTDWFTRYKVIGDNEQTKWSIQSQLANNSSFQSVIKKVWNGTSDVAGFKTILATYTDQNGKIDGWESQISKSVAMNEYRWGFISDINTYVSNYWGTVSHGSTFADNVTYLQTGWTATRANWLNGQINDANTGFCDTDYTQIATPTLTVTDAGGNVVESAFAVNTKLTLKAATTESYVTYNFYDGATLLGSNTTGTLEITPDSLGEHQYKVVTAYGSDTQNSNIVTANAVQGKETGAAITNMTLYFKGTNLTYLNPYLEIKDSEGNVVMEKTPLTRATEHFGTHFEGSYRFYMYTVNIASLTVGKNYTFTFTTNGSSMSATVVPDLTADWFYTGADIYFAVDNLHTGKEAVDITNNTTARTTCRNSVHMITNTGTANKALLPASLAGISSDDTVYFLGDMDKNGTLDIKDAAAVQLKLAQLADTEAGDSLLGDFNIDGEFNIKDAAAIQLSLAKLY